MTKKQPRTAQQILDNADQEYIARLREEGFDVDGSVQRLANAGNMRMDAILTAVDLKTNEEFTTSIAVNVLLEEFPDAVERWHKDLNDSNTRPDGWRMKVVQFVPHGNEVPAITLNKDGSVFDAGLYKAAIHTMDRDGNKVSHFSDSSDHAIPPVPIEHIPDVIVSGIAACEEEYELVSVEVCPASLDDVLGELLGASIEV